MIMLKSGHYKFEAPSSKRHARYDLPESGERVKKKPKRTGHGLRSFFKRMRGEESEPVESERDMDQGIKERVHSPSSEKMCLLKKKDLSCSEGVNDSGRDLVLGEQDRSNEASEVDERGNEKNTNEENCNSTNEACKEDRHPIPLKQKVKVEDQSAGRDIGSYVDDLQRKCDKRMKKLVLKQKGQIEEFHRTWDGNFSKLETDYQLEAAIIRSIYLASSKLKVTDKLEILKSEFAKKRAENNLQKEMKLKELETEQLAERNDEIRKADTLLAEAKARICGKPNCSSKALSSGSQNEETSRGSESKVHIGTKDVVPLTQKHGENIDSDSGNADDEVLSMLNKTSSLELEISPRNEGRISSSDIQIPDLVEQISQTKQSGDVPSESSQTVAEGIVNDANLVNISSTTLIEGIVEADAVNSPDAENSGGHERISPNLPASGECRFDDVQSVELHGDIPSALPDIVTNENLDDANMMDSITETPNTLFDEGDAIDSPDEEHLTQPKHFGSDRMHKGPAEPAETVANEIVDIVNPEELSANISVKGFGEVEAIHPSDASLSQSNETDRTTIDDHGFDGQVFETSEQTESLRHPCPLSPLQVQEVQDEVSAAVQVHDAGKIKSTPSEIVVSKHVDSVANSLSNIEPQACEEPAIETQSPSATVVSTSKIIDTVTTELSFLKSHDHDKSIDKHQIASQIEVADLEIVDAEARVSVSEVVDSAETLQSIHVLQEQVEPVMESQSTSRIEVTVPQNLSNAEEQVEDASTAVAISEVVDTAETVPSILELQEQVEPIMETQSMSRIEVTVPQNRSNAEEQVEDASTAVNEVSLETDDSNAGITDNLTPVQSHLDAQPIESFSQLQLTDPESQNHNVEIPSEAVETVVLSDDHVSQLMGDLLGLMNTRDARPENQSSPATRVQTSASLQNYAAAEGVTQLPSHQAAALNPLSLVSDPLINELEKNHREIGALQKSYQETMSGLKSEYEKEKEELIAQVKKKYQLKFDDTVSQFTLKKNHLQQSLKKIVMNKLLADTYRLSCSNTSTWPLKQQGFSASSTQCHQQLVRPTAPNPQISCLIGQPPVHQASVNHDTRSTHITSRNEQLVHQASVHHDTRSTHVTSRIGQPMQQLRAPPHATRLEPITNQTFAAQSVQAAQQVTPTVSGLWGMNSVLPTAVTHFGMNIQSSPQFQASTPAAISSMATSNMSQTLWNLQQMQLLQQQQQQQQSLAAAPQWRSNSQNYQHLGYPLQVLAQNHQNLGGMQGNQNSFGVATTAICLSDDD